MYKRTADRPERSDKGKKKAPRINTHVNYEIPAGETREGFLATVAFIRKYV